VSVKRLWRTRSAATAPRNARGRAQRSDRPNESGRERAKSTTVKNTENEHHDVRCMLTSAINRRSNRLTIMGDTDWVSGRR
jgi:hypothetical protein